ncbi:MAG: SDR family NAD(P)-dependent oxidoreductase [Acidimicrobiales bacterium]
MTARLDDLTVLVTGAGGGIGTSVVNRLVAGGANVIAFDLAGPGLDALDGPHVACYAGDATNEADWEAVVELAVARFGGLTGLVNNAGIEGSIAPILEYSNQMFDAVMAVNVKGVWLGLKACIPLMKEGGGSIVNLSSVAGLRGATNLSAYSASKHAVIGLTKSVAKELGAVGIRCTAVGPSPIDTRMMRSLEDGMKGDGEREVIQAAIASAIPVGRYGAPAEVADLICFLLSDDARFLSGAAIPIDGAMTV